ncbi:hypothetical protein ACFO5R_06955 [Halosolutus amylolyticus]|uniref:Tat (Twin-arginine translocation) pathway signal sequence n=1 Tax=Halosolutus amylolyticus TaxID=2932267 RepID=A0ABD5PMA4_9EURY|nr:hypothetical protein [Halosolutus amylolyticus]
MTAAQHGSRRRFLAGLATASGIAVAGCADLPWEDEGASTGFSRSDAEEILADSEPAVPDVVRPVPVEPAAKALDAQRTRVDDLLSDVPDAIPADDVPNGVVRESIADRRDSAIEYRDEAADASGADRYHALRTLGRARKSARASATTLAAIEAETEALLAELSDERTAVESAVDDRCDGIAYRGEDGDDGRLRAALFFAELERDLQRASHRVGRWSVDDTATVIDLGGAAGDLEFATATTAIWDHCTDRYAADTGDRVDLEPVFADALETSADRAGAVDLPDQDGDDWLSTLVDGEVDTGFDQTVLWEAVRPVYDARDGLRDADGIDSTGRNLANGLRDALRFEQEYRAFERVRDRFEAGELARPDSIDPIGSERTAAISAAESAAEELTRPSLGTDRLTETIRTLSWTDDKIRRKADGDPGVVVSLAGEFGEYVCLRARFEVLPEAVDAFRGRLLDPEP